MDSQLYMHKRLVGMDKKFHDRFKESLTPNTSYFYIQGLLFSFGLFSIIIFLLFIPVLIYIYILNI